MSKKAFITLTSIIFLSLSSTTFASTDSTNSLDSFCEQIASEYKIEKNADAYSNLGNELFEKLIQDIKTEKLSKEEADQRYDTIVRLGLCSDKLLIDELQQVLKSVGL